MIITGDCLEAMKDMPDNRVTAIVTDPPYALEFMGKGWDKVLPSDDIWKEALRVIKPGGLLLSFGGTRTYHRLTCSIEDAGWQIRDCLMWLYGSGFPKSLDISKAIDKAAGAEREVVGSNPNWRGNKENHKNAIMSTMVPGEAEVISAPSTPSAKLWDGYGTALKPAWEPIVVAMKPCAGTFAQNALEHGVAGVNVDGCRVGTEVLKQCKSGNTSLMGGLKGTSNTGGEITPERTGRFPSNVILDEESGKMLDEQSRFFYCAKASKAERNKGLEDMPEKQCADAALRDSGRGKTATNHHPTVKPIALMRYLIRLVTMPSGTIILDPFMGSGSTGVACRDEGVEFIGIERDPEYAEIARRRIDA